MIKIEAVNCFSCPAYWSGADNLCLIRDEVSEPTGREDITNPLEHPGWCPTRAVGPIAHCNQCPAYDNGNCCIQTEINMYGGAYHQQQDPYAHTQPDGMHIPWWCPFNLKRMEG